LALIIQALIPVLTIHPRHPGVVEGHVSCQFA